MHQPFPETRLNDNIPLFALKTNMLFDAVGGPNLGLEVYLGGGFSVTGDVALAFWESRNRLYGLQTFQGGVTGKYWFYPSDWSPGRPLTGWNAGLYAMGGSRYDFQFKSGVSGPNFVSVGFTVGWSVRIHEVLNLEMAFAAGYVHTPELRRYDRPVEGQPVWREIRHNVNTFLPTKLQLNLVWLINYSGE
jgi:hypothetical protein